MIEVNCKKHKSEKLMRLKYVTSIKNLVKYVNTDYYFCPKCNKTYKVQVMVS